MSLKRKAKKPAAVGPFPWDAPGFTFSLQPVWPPGYCPQPIDDNAAKRAVQLNNLQRGWPAQKFKLAGSQ